MDSLSEPKALDNETNNASHAPMETETSSIVNNQEDNWDISCDTEGESESSKKELENKTVSGLSQETEECQTDEVNQIAQEELSIESRQNAMEVSETESKENLPETITAIPSDASASTSVSQDSTSADREETVSCEDGDISTSDANERTEGDGSSCTDDSELKTTIDTDAEESTATSEELGDTDADGSLKHQIQSLYHIKWIQWKGLSTPVITQNENGPCPLLAIINVLLLQRRISIPPMQEIVSSAQLMEYLGDCILTQAPESLPEGAQLNYEQNMHDAIGIMYKLQTGLDVNVKFTGVAEFEFTPECVVFDLLSVRLLHGWLVDHQNEEAVLAIGSSSYNQLVEKIIASKQDGADCQVVSAGLVAESFLEQTASQLTYHGLYELNTQMAEEELCVFFRNNHFNTLYKHKKELFLLATDQGYLTEEKVVWETLSNVEGDGCFVDANFRTVSQPQSTPAEVNIPQPVMAAQGISQEDQDYLVALTLQEEQTNADVDQREVQTQVPVGPSLSGPQSPFVPPQGEPNVSPQEWSDLQLAMQLQEEERRQQEQEQQQQQQEQHQQQQQPPQLRPQAPSPRRAPQPHGQPVQQRPQATQQSQGPSDKCAIL